MRIQTNREYEYRNDAIERAADFYGCNKTKAVVSACDDVPKLVAAARAILERDDLTHEQCKEIAEILDVDELSIEHRSIWTIGE